ncbi:hypothetical protein [Cellulomonas biazotea]|nr:hypothetical protein [Cellulomonas biazotea]
MGRFSVDLFSDGRWSDEATAPTWLSLEIHDSDIAVVRYAPAGPGTGLVYLGYQPRDYFDDPGASAPVDVVAEARGLATWALTAVGTVVEPEEVEPLLAREGIESAVDLFVEETVTTLFALLGVPLPAELAPAD